VDEGGVGGRQEGGRGVGRGGKGGGLEGVERGWWGEE
jgi:hypothetical protein